MPIKLEEIIWNPRGVLILKKLFSLNKKLVEARKIVTWQLVLEQLLELSLYLANSSKMFSWSGFVKLLVNFRMDLIKPLFSLFSLVIHFRNHKIVVKAEN